MDIKELAEQAISELQGTCKGIADCGEEIEAAFNDKDFCDIIDNTIFCCEQCEWWCELSEMSEIKENCCTDCED